MNAVAPAINEFDSMLGAIAREPFAFDLFAFMRQLEANQSHLPKLGWANKYRDEPLQFGQEPSSIFASASIAKLYTYTGNRKPKLSIHSFGLYGPNGAMPLVFTEYVKERMTHHNDYAMSDFIDLFHNRLIMLFYRAWADANSCASLDHSNENFTRFIANLCASGYSPDQHTDAIPNHARLHHAGHLLRQVHNADGLKHIIANFFKVPVEIKELIQKWLPLPKEEQSCFGNIKGMQLGVDVVIGKKVMSRQHHFRIHIGPLSLQEYDDFLPYTRRYKQLRDWVRTYVGIEFSWDLCLEIQAKSSMGIQLGQQKQLGWNTWLGKLSTATDHYLPHSRCVIFNPENGIY